MNGTMAFILSLISPSSYLDRPTNPEGWIGLALLGYHPGFWGLSLA